MKAYQHILVPTDGTPLSLKAAKHAASLAKDLKARVTAVYVIPPWTPPVTEESTIMTTIAFTEEQYRKDMEVVANKALGKVAVAVAGSKVKCETLSIGGEQPWQGILKAARTKKCDLIVMGSHGRGALGSLVLGSETAKVLSHSKTPVLVCR
jgi:nucleotide-binding universal stress UspA family protein